MAIVCVLVLLSSSLYFLLDIEGGYWFFNHSAWNGITVADLVFPWFIWIMGTSMAISFTSLEKKRTPKREVLYKIIRRFIILAGWHPPGSCVMATCVTVSLTSYIQFWVCSRTTATSGRRGVSRAS
jgi:hypothetical protein